MSASPLLDLFQKNSEVSAVFGLSMCTATSGNRTVGNDSILLDFFWKGGCVWDLGKYSTRKVCLCVSAEKLKICSYTQVGKKSLSASCFLD